MAISYPLTAPTTGIKQVRFRPLNVVGMTQSPFTLEQQVQKQQGERWAMDVTLTPMKRANAEEWMSFLMSLKGRLGTFNMGLPGDLGTGQGVLDGTPLVNGASQTGTSLVIDGASNNTTDWAKAGDYIQIGSGSSAELKKVLVDADSDGSGNVTLEIWPSIRTSPANNSAVVVSSPVGLWRLQENEISFDVDTAQIMTTGFTAIEAI